MLRRLAFVGLLLLVAQTARAADVLGNFQLGVGWATFGLVLPAGVTKTGVQIGSLSTQTDVKVRWPDGSIRFAVVTAKIPFHNTYAITSAPADSGPLAPRWPTATARLTINSDVWTATANPGTDLWLDGPLVKESRTTATPMLAGRPHPFLRVIFDIRTYAEGGSRVDVTVQNVLDSGGGQVKYNVELVIDGSSKFPSPGIIQHQYLTRWRKVYTTGGLQVSEVVPDVSSMLAAKAVPTFLPSITNATYTTDEPRFDLLQRGGVAFDDMGSPGGRAEIAPYPDWIARYLVHKQPSQRDFMMRSADLAGSWPIHVLMDDGRVPSVDDRPKYWLDPRTSAGNKPAGDLTSPQQLKPDAAHVPSLAYVPYLISGDRYYADEVRMWANWGIITAWPDDYWYPREGAKGYLKPHQVRGIAWTLRNLIDAAAYLPDDDPDKAYLVQKAKNNLEWMDQYATTYQSPFDTLWPGKFGDGDPPAKTQIGPWQHYYTAWAADHGVDQGFGAGATYRDRIVRFAVRLFNSEPDYPKAYGAPFLLELGTYTTDYVRHYYTTMKEIFKTSYPDRNLPAQQFNGYYGPETRLMLLIGVRNGTNGAQSALDYLMSWHGAYGPEDNMINDLNKRAGWALSGANPLAPWDVARNAIKRRK